MNYAQLPLPMKEPVETFTFTKEVPVADADGTPIREGSVIREITDGQQGVVIQIIRKGFKGWAPPMVQLGDMVVKTSPGCSRVTNRYNQWRHVPREEQTYEQRYTAWLHTRYDHDDDRQISKDEGLAIDGIMALLPIDIVDWEHGPWPDRLEDALKFLVEHLSEAS